MTAPDESNGLPGERYSLFPLPLFALSVVLFLLLDACSYSLPEAWGRAFAMAHAALIVAVAVFNVRWGMLFFAVSVILCGDIPRLGSDVPLNNLLTVPFQGVALVNYVSVALIALAVFFLAIRSSREPAVFSLTAIDACVLAIAAIFAVASLHGYASVSANVRGALNDLSLPILVCGLYVAVRASTRTPEDVLQLWGVIVTAMGAKSVLWAAWFFTGSGVALEETVRVSPESGRVLLILVLLYGIVVNQRALKLSLAERGVALAVAGCAGLDILVYGARMPWLLSGLGCLILFALGDVRQKLRWATLALVCLLGAAAVVGWFRPETFETLGKFADTLKFWEEGQVSSSHSTMVRVYEYKNIHAQLAAHGNLVLGDGPGAVFTDEYHPFPFGLEEYDYTVDEILSRRFQNPHGPIPNLMLNTGYGGMAAFLAAMAVLYAACFLSFSATADPRLKSVLLALLAFLPTMVYNAWSPKTYMLLGILLGIAGVMAARTRDIDLPGKASLD